MTDTVPYYEDFTEIKKKIWSMLTNAVKDRGSPFRIPVFICGNQSDFDGRIVVLRKADEANNLVQYHSDIRSDKIAKLKANKNAALLFYDKEEKIQVRLKVAVSYTHLRAHETVLDLVCRLLLEKKKWFTSSDYRTY